MNMTWEGLIRLRETSNNLIARHKGCRLLVIEPVHCGSNNNLKMPFFGHPVDVFRFVRETCKRHRLGQMEFDLDRRLKNKGPVGQLGPVDPQITPCLE